jgi:hypothetical protein
VQLGNERIGVNGFMGGFEIEGGHGRILAMFKGG